jgi:nucleosome binding factor SPN SPT16 subunit
MLLSIIIYYLSSLCSHLPAHLLVHVLEMPCLIVALDDIQIAYFERCHFALGTFDLALVFKVCM